MTASTQEHARSWTDRLGLKHGPISLEDTISPEFFILEREAIFRRSWLYVGREEQVSAAGAYFTKEIEILSASVLVVRDREERVHAYYNVCPHRGNKLVWDTDADKEVSGRCNSFVCKFHGIAFRPDGGVAKLTDRRAWMDGEGDKLHLADIPLEIWNGFIFVNLDPKGPRQTLREFIGEDFWSNFDFPFEKMTERFSARAEAKANWKAMVDGFAEIYHAATTHVKIFPLPPEMMREGLSVPGLYYGVSGQHRQYIMPALPKGTYNYDFERLTESSGVGPQIPLAVETEILPSGANPEQIAAWGTSSTMMFPNFYLQIYRPGWFVTYGIWPLAHNRMRFEIDIYMPPARNFSELLSHKASVQIFLEAAMQDFSLLEAQQKGLEMRAFSTYPLTDEEVCVRHFHQEVQSAVDRYLQESG
jgi:Rieske 2Fe-2S family protein